MLAPFVLPEGLVVPMIILPEDMHEIEHRAADIGEDVCDVLVISAVITICLVTAVALVRPESCLR